MTIQREKVHRILLINSHVRSSNVRSAMVGQLGEEPYPPAGLLSIAAYLRLQGYHIGLLDIPSILKQKFRRSQEQKNPNWNVTDAVVEEIVTESLKDFKPDAVGISCLYSGKFRGTILISEIVKRVLEKCPVVVGGLHPTVFAREAIERVPSIDFVVIGEGEESFGALLSSILLNKSPLSRVDGLAYRSHSGARVNPKTNYIEDLDKLPLPAWDIIKFEDYAIDDEAWKNFWDNPKGLKLRYRMPLLTSRSCPMQCSFCAMHFVHGKKLRFRSVEHCMKEIEWLYHEYGVNYFSIIDDNFTMNKRRVIDIANQIIQRDLRIYLDAPSGISMHFFDKEVFEALKAAGMQRLFLPVESGSDYIREHVMGKKLSREKIFECSDLMRNEKDLSVRAFFVIGMPQESEETLEASWNLINELFIDDVSIHFATPFPGTALYKEVVENNLLEMPLDDVLFADDFQQSSDRPLIKPYKLKTSELIDFKSRAEDLFEQRRIKYGVKRNRSIKHLYSRTGL